MAPRIKSGELVTVSPIGSADELSVGDVVLCKVRGSEYLHLVKAIQGDRLLIGNNKGRLNGWVSRKSVYGLLVSKK